MAPRSRGVFDKTAEITPITSPEVDEAEALLSYYASHPILGYAHLHHVTEHGTPLRFDNRPYLIPFYELAHQEPDRVTMKSVQVGVTEQLVSEMFHWAEEGLSVLYVLPTQQFRGDFVKNRIDKITRLSSHYQHQVRHSIGGSNAVGMKHFGRGTLKFVGSNTPNEFLEFPGDVLIIDEHDRCSPEHLEMAADRISASRRPIRRIVGNPTGEQVGLSKIFWEESTAAFWHVSCPSCKYRQHMEWYANVVEEVENGAFVPRDREWSSDLIRDLYPMCVSCGKPLDRLAQGEFVETQPGKPRKGRHLDKLYVHTTTIRKLWTKFQEVLDNPIGLQVFHNNYLGLGYTPKGARLDDTALANAKRDYYMPDTGVDCTMGVDVGSRHLHVRISDHPEPGIRRAVYIGVVPMSEGMSSLDELMDRYDVRCAVVDWQPETSAAKAFRSRYPGRVYLVRYSANEKIVELKPDPSDTNLIVVDRTQSMDDSMKDLVKGNNWLPANAPALDNGAFVSQMKAIVRIYDEERGVHRWEATGPDHYRQADNYEKVAFRLRYNLSYHEALLAAAGPARSTRRLPPQVQMLLDSVGYSTAPLDPDVQTDTSPKAMDLFDLDPTARVSYRYRAWRPARLR